MLLNLKRKQYFMQWKFHMKSVHTFLDERIFNVIFKWFWWFFQSFRLLLKIENTAKGAWPVLKMYGGFVVFLEVLIFRRFFQMIFGGYLVGSFDYGVNLVQLLVYENFGWLSQKSQLFS